MIIYFIFFDRENLAFSKKDNDPLVNWNRWKKKAIDSQTRTAHGAERYIRSGRKIFLDKDLKTPFPFSIDHQKNGGTQNCCSTRYKRCL